MRSAFSFCLALMKFVSKIRGVLHPREESVGAKAVKEQAAKPRPKTYSLTGKYSDGYVPECQSKAVLIDGQITTVDPAEFSVVVTTEESSS